MRGILRVKVMEAGGQDDGPNLDLLVPFLLLKINRPNGTEFFTGLAFTVFEVGTIGRINDRDAWDRLREGVIDGGAFAQPQVELGWDFLPRAFFDARSAAGT